MPRELTLEQVLDAKPCHNIDKVRAWADQHGTSIAVDKIPTLSFLSWRDRWWLLTQTGVLSDKELRLVAVRIAHDALMSERSAGREPDERSWTAIQVAEDYAHGKASIKQLNAAAADAAAYAADADAAAAAAAAYVNAAHAAYATAARVAYAGVEKGIFQSFFDIAYFIITPSIATPETDYPLRS